MDPTPIDITDDATDHLISVAGDNSVHDVTFQFQLQQAIHASLHPKQSEEDFMVYFKGLVSHETVKNNIKMSFTGIGIAICDPTGSCLFESSKSGLLEAGDGGRGAEGDRVELEALVEALSVADAKLRLKRVRIVTDCDSVYRYLIGERHSPNCKIAALVDKVNLIKSKFVYHALFPMKRSLIKFVYKLARDAIKSETAKWVGSNSDSDVIVTEQCRICFEYLEAGQLFPVNKCQHRYCFSCIGKHIEAKLLDGKLPECPHEKCDSKIGIESCKKLLKPELYRIMRSRVNEASIPPTDKVYCPFSDCSALMSKTEVKVHTPTSSLTAVGDTGMRKCVECDRHFCINCKVPWHPNISCSDYMNSFLFRSSNEAKVKSLATKEHWRECIKCKNLVELAYGCYHISCRCGHEFCYKCGAEWINKTPTCKCPIWNERNLIYAQQR